MENAEPRAFFKLHRTQKSAGTRNERCTPAPFKLHRPKKSGVHNRKHRRLDWVKIP
ncbi:hypothetical protein AB434_1523 [Heyndrickxia coagulans]|uniref:Uncharacterized protein n=1 Tax=Heyndrickxia coagulans TaxID=1398 RepID=A0AAN0T9U8_HEYCO|nr:hypothetical protein SB48_HM08orf06080 [Heyndrickxia coagulans]AKN53928.1 hypothetical protein AB434_1523 [Heyndrickxia coagulans]